MMDWLQIVAMNAAQFLGIPLGGAKASLEDGRSADAGCCQDEVGEIDDINPATGLSMEGPACLFDEAGNFHGHNMADPNDPLYGHSQGGDYAYAADSDNPLFCR